MDRDNRWPNKTNKTTGEKVFYNASNSGLPDNTVSSIAIDGSGNKWIGTWGGGLTSFDGTNWTMYNTSNSGLPGNYISSLAIDSSGNKWIGASGGMAHFDGTNWTVYDTSNSGLPGGAVISIAIDSSGNTWIGAIGGLARFDGTNWTVYNTSNSGLPDNFIISLAIDGSGNKWIGTDEGLAVYNKGGVIAVKENKNNVPVSSSLVQNYPNPFNDFTTIEFNKKVGEIYTLKLFNGMGQNVRTISNISTNKIILKREDLKSGVYFILIISSDKRFQASGKLIVE